MTLHLLASIQSLMLALDTIGHQASPLYQRASRAEAYLIARHNRDLSPEEAEVFELVREEAMNDQLRELVISFALDMVAIQEAGNDEGLLPRVERLAMDCRRVGLEDAALICWSQSDDLNGRDDMTSEQGMAQQCASAIRARA